MSARVDGILAGVALLAFVFAFFVTDATLSTPLLVLGGTGTIAFELAASRHSRAVRRVWERPVVQLTALAGAVAIAGGGAVVAPVLVLSAGIGALVTYLLFLSVVVAIRS